MVATEKLTLIHFNDVYNVESAEKQEPVGGAARMRTAIKKYSDRNPLILFSGDCFAPSICKHSTFLFFVFYKTTRIYLYASFERSVINWIQHFPIPIVRLRPLPIIIRYFMIRIWYESIAKRKRKFAGLKSHLEVYCTNGNSFLSDEFLMFFAEMKYDL